MASKSGNFPLGRVASSSRRAQDGWYQRRAVIQAERAGIRAALLTEIGAELAAASKAALALLPDSVANCAAMSRVESLQSLVGTVFYTGYDYFAGMGRDLAENLAFYKSEGFLLPSLDRYVAFLATADARVGEYPR